MKDGAFEAHITVDCAGSAASVGRLEEWSAAQGWKFTHIVLARGLMPSQPMLTLHGRGSYQEQLRICRRAAEALRGAGFSPVRVKIEVPPSASVVPRSDAHRAAEHRPAEHGADGQGSRYFEHHLKVLLDVGAEEDLGALTATAAAHGAHVSWNARRTRAATGQEERFVTQRCHGVGLPTAEKRLAALMRAVRGLQVRGRPLEIVEVEQEFVVHDSNLAVDHGWITPVGEEVVR